MPVIYGQSSIGRRSVAVPQREHVPQEPKKRKGRSRAVLVDGVRYDTVAAAAEAIGCSGGTVANAIKRGTFMVRGHKVSYSWK